MTFTAGTSLSAAALNAALETDFMTWTPTITGTTSPTVNEARYSTTPTWCHAELVFTLTAGVTGSLTVTLPVTATNTAAGVPLGTASYLDTSASARYMGFFIAAAANATTASGVALGTSGQAMTTGTNPFTWASGDVVSVFLSYPIS